MTTFKDWIEPNGIFIINVPVDWQYKNMILKQVKEKSPYSFEPYENSKGAFQISCYPLSERGINKNFPVQKTNSEIEWFATEMPNDASKFKIKLWYAQVGDQFLMIKFVYQKTTENTNDFKKQFEKINEILSHIRVIPISDRRWAKDLSKHDNFLASLVASYDLLENALESDSYIEIIVIVSNQIDAYLRSSIIIHQQLKNKTNNIEIKYIYQRNKERGILERQIYQKALNLKIIDSILFKKLNTLYNKRNQVIHRYIISNFKTKDFIKIVLNYLKMSEKIRKICGSYEEKQFGIGYGVYGKGFSKKDKFSFGDKQRVFSMANDKHLLKKLERKISDEVKK